MTRMLDMTMRTLGVTTRGFGPCGIHPRSRLRTAAVAVSLAAAVLPAAAHGGAAATASVIPISEAKQINDYGEPVKWGEEVTVSGVVTVANGTFTSRDLDIHIQDGTAGLYVYLRNAAYYRLNLGDSIVVTGIIEQEGRTPKRNNTSLTLLSVDGIEILEKAQMPEPLRVTAAELAEPSVPPLEFYEGRLVRVEGLTIDPADWPTAAGADKFITATDATGQLSIRLDRDTDIPGSQPPRQPFIAVGVIMQDSSNPFTGYKLWPRSRYGDFLVTGSGSGTAALEPDFVETSEDEFDLHVRLEGNGTDVITSFEIILPLADGWGWEADAGNVSLLGPGLEGSAVIEVTAAGVIIRGSAIRDGETYGVVTFEGVNPPGAVTTSEVIVKTSVDDLEFEEIALQPSIKALLPKPDVVVNEVFPGDGTSSQSNAFVELHNRGAKTAYLEGFALSDLGSLPYCDPVVRLTFGAADTIPSGGYLVIGETQSGFMEKYGFGPDVVAPISPLGRVSGDGATVGAAGAYEAIVLWRDEAAGDLVDHCEYSDPVLIDEDMCDGLGGQRDAYPIIPPVSYALARDEDRESTGSSNMDFELSSEPTPGGKNVAADSAPPEVVNVKAHSQEVIEVFFNEPCDSSDMAGLSRYEIGGKNPSAAYPSLSLEKVALLFEDAGSGAGKALVVAEIRDASGNVALDLSYTFKAASVRTTAICEVQEYDQLGFSPFLGENVTVIGFVTVPQGVFQTTYNSIYVQGLDGCGVNVFSYDPPSPNPRLGDLVIVTGQVEEYISEQAGATTELYMEPPPSERLLSAFYPELGPYVVRTGEVGIEDNEGKFMLTEGAVISANEYGFYLDDGSGGIQVYQNYTDIDYTQYQVGMYIRAQGVILQYDRTLPFLDGYELVPRWESDIVIVEDAYSEQPILHVEPRVFCPSCGEEGFSVRFVTPSAAQVTLRIFDGKGRLAVTLFSGMSVGESEKIWDGRSENGEPVPPGLYICHLQSVEAGTGRKTTDSAPIVVGIQLE